MSHPLAETGIQTLRRYVREIVGEARRHAVGALAGILILAAMYGLLIVGAR